MDDDCDLGRVGVLAGSTLHVAQLGLILWIRLFCSILASPSNSNPVPLFTPCRSSVIA